MAIEHDYFGIIDEDASGALSWAETLDFADQPVDVELSADDESAVSEAALDSAAALLQAMEGFDSRARDALIAQLSERSSVTSSYIDEHVEEMGESLIDLLVHNSGDIPLDVLRSLQLVRVLLRPENDDDDESFAVFEYSISPDDTDELLTVGFDARGHVVAVDSHD